MMMTKRIARGLLRCALLSLVAAVSCGCELGGLRLTSPPPPLSEVPVLAVLEPAKVAREDFMVVGDKGQPTPLPRSMVIPWISPETVDPLCRKYLEDAKLFRELHRGRPADSSDLTLILRPRVTFRQYVQPSFHGTMLAFGTVGLWTVLGGPESYRWGQCEVTLSARNNRNRRIRTYTGTAEFDKKMVTTAPDQLGPLVSEAFTKALEQVTRSIARENDLLVQALSLAPKGTKVYDSSKRIDIHSPETAIVHGTLTITGQVTAIGKDEPVELLSSVNGDAPEGVTLKEGETPSTRKFNFSPQFEEGTRKVNVTLTLRSKPPADQPMKKLVEKQISYYALGPKKFHAIRRQWAVIVGISRYGPGITSGKSGQLRPLKYADRDARRFREFLLSPTGGGFQSDNVLCLTNEKATVTQVRGALWEFLARAEKDDLVVIYFSGHGLTRPGARTDNHFLLCYDTDLVGNRVPSTALPMWDLSLALKRFIKAERIVVFADACYSGAIADDGSLRAKGDGEQENLIVEYLQKLAVTGPGLFFLTACSADERSYECDQLRSGVFTHFLLEGLSGKADADGDGTVTVSEIAKYVQYNVARYVTKQFPKGLGGRPRGQNPQEGGQYDAELPLAVTKAKKQITLRGKGKPN